VRSRSVVPSFAKQAKLGQPQLLWCRQRWASPQIEKLPARQQNYLLRTIDGFLRGAGVTA
jgi:hypothetical protein